MAPMQPPMGQPEGAFPPQGAPYAPPAGQGGVNPLGGTMAADSGAFAAAFGNAPPPPPGYGPPGAPPAYGAPPPQDPYGAPGAMGTPPPAPYGAPPAPYGAPPGDPYGSAPPPQYGQQPPYGPPAYGQQPPAYGQPAPYGQPAAPYGQPAPQAIAPYGQPAMAPPAVAGTLASAGTGTGPTRRNALMTFLIPGVVMFGGIILGTILAIVGLATVGSLLSLAGVAAGGALYLLAAIKMIGEVNSVTRNPAFPWWPLVVPFYSIYFMWLLVPAEVTKAKQMMGVQAPTRSIVLYVFLWHFALASDLNDMVR